MNRHADYSHIAAEIIQFREPPERENAQLEARSAAALKEKFLQDWKLVKSARFNAAQRLEQKEQASLFAVTLGAMFSVFIGPMEQMFASYLTQYELSVVKYMAFVAGHLSLILGLIGQVKGYSRRARNLDLCAKEVNSVCKDLEITPINTSEELRHFIRRYEQALKMYEDNHDPLDRKLAQLQRDIASSTGNHKKLERELRGKERAKFIDIYGIHAAVWGIPILLGLLFLILLRPVEFSSTPTNGAANNSLNSVNKWHLHKKTFREGP